jgi:hypothetical protein
VCRLQSYVLQFNIQSQMGFCLLMYQPLYTGFKQWICSQFCYSCIYQSTIGKGTGYEGNILHPPCWVADVTTLTGLGYTDVVFRSNEFGLWWGRVFVALVLLAPSLICDVLPNWIYEECMFKMFTEREDLMQLIPYSEDSQNSLLCSNEDPCKEWFW